MKNILHLSACVFLSISLVLFVWGCGCDESKTQGPLPPTNLTASGQINAISLSWQASPSTFVTGYNIYTAQASGGPYYIAATIAAQTSYTLIGLITDTTFYFVVRAVGNGMESGNSNEASAKPLFLQAPTNLAATPGNTIVTLTWQASPGAAGYKIYIGSPDCSTFISTTTTTGTSVQVTGLTNGIQYCFLVRAYNTISFSGDSNQATATPSASAPLAPTLWRATPSLTSVTLTWTAGPGPAPTGYRIYTETSSGNYSFVGTTYGTIFIVTGLSSGTTYYFVVIAVNASGESAYSNELSATTYSPSSLGADLVFTYPSPTIPPGGTAPTGLPLNNAIDVPLNIVITGTSTDTNILTISSTTFTMTITDGLSEIPGRIEISYDDSSVIFIPDNFLEPNTTYTITAWQDNYFTTLSFTTVQSISSNLASVGQGFALKIPDGSITQPPGIGGILEPFYQDINFVFAVVDKQQVSTSPDSGFIQFTGGEGNIMQTGLYPGSFVLSLSGSYLGPYARLSGTLALDIEGFVLTIDSFNISGTFADWSAYGGAGIGITDGTLTSIATCATLPPDIKAIIEQFCTDTGYLIIMGSFYAPPFTVMPAMDINGRTLAANITYPTDGAVNVPVNTMVWVDFTTTTPGQAACIAVTSTSISLTLRDWTTGTLVSGTTGMKTASVPGCNTGTNPPIVGATFTPTNALVSGQQFKALSVLDLSPVAGARFTTQ